MKLHWVAVEGIVLLAAIVLFFVIRAMTSKRKAPAKRAEDAKAGAASKPAAEEPAQKDKAAAKGSAKAKADAASKPATAKDAGGGKGAAAEKKAAAAKDANGASAAKPAANAKPAAAAAAATAKPAADAKPAAAAAAPAKPAASSGGDDISALPMLGLELGDVGVADSPESEDITVAGGRAAVLEALGGAPMPELGDGPFVELSEEGTNPTMPFQLILVSAVGQSHVGRRRKLNEDSYLVLPEHSLFVVADGMGGHAAGEVASRLAVDTLAEAFNNKKFDGQPHPSRPKRGDELVRAFQMANARVYAQARSTKAQEGMGTTLLAARFSPNKQRVYIAHVGDSRCYRLRGEELVQLTQDHTLGNFLKTKGPQAEMLTRAVGIEEEVEVELVTDTPQAGDLYVLCSDGLSRMVPDALIRQLLQGGEDIEETCQLLIAVANQRGGKDNVTVILVRVQQTKELLQLLSR